MLERALGTTGLSGSLVGLGCGALGELDEAAAAGLVHAALELGVRVFDTARSYGESEARLGRALAGREALVVTKGGYGVEGAEDWTPAAVRGGIERALRTLGRDCLDVFLLHSCGAGLLARGELLEPLLEAKRAGKVRAVGYSGDGEALEHAVRCGAFDAVECSVSLLDQAALRAAIPEASRRGAGVIAKRALGNAVWRHPTRPPRADEAALWDRLRAMGGATTELAVRFAAFAPGVSWTLVGTRSAEHLAAAVRACALGPLPPPTTEALRERFVQAGASWPGVV